MGVAAIMQAFTLAINSFFKEKRGRAVGVGMSITGLGSIYMPLLMSFLMYLYGWRYAVLILSAICLHSLVAACLLRPAKWYLRDPPTSEEAAPLNNEHVREFVNGSVTPSSKVVGMIIQIIFIWHFRVTYILYFHFHRHCYRYRFTTPTPRRIRGKRCAPVKESINAISY